MRLDEYSVAFLTLNEHRPVLSAEEADALQNSHMSHLADLHEAGHLLAAGPLHNDFYRGLLIFKVTVEVAHDANTRPATEQRAVIRTSERAWAGTRIIVSLRS